ncbi:MAG: sodium:solute symporter [Flavobacteriaceae bacterium]|nr:sodium:solute symporter [Flavobacteriaceae bacterium]
MQPLHILILISVYFGLLLVVSYFTKTVDSNEVFFKAKKDSPWYLVAFGMIGASLSGVTFISVPGWVEASQFGYMQVVLGYIVGYFIIATVLLPLYYRLNLISIYSYLETRFGIYSYKTGAIYFLISRTIGASFRLFLVANVLQLLVFDALNIDYWITVSITIFLIWVYTYKSGIKTVIWTDALQTLFMLIAVGVCIVLISDDLGLHSGNFIEFISNSPYSKTFFFDDFRSANFFWKQFLSGAFIAIVMTGLDQDMMQKNLTCRSLKDAQKNMFWFTIVLTIVNLFFLILGLLLTSYAQQNGIDAHKDALFPTLANEYLGAPVAFFFILGLIAAAYSSADSALTALTTSFSIDILDIEKRYDEIKQIAIRKKIHILFTFVFIAVIISFKYLITDASVIAKLFKFAGFTYGPLLGLYAFGLFTKYNIRDQFVPLISILSVVISIIINNNSLLWFGYEFGFEILIFNGLLTFIGLTLAIKKIS